MRRRRANPSGPPTAAPGQDGARDLTVLAVPFYFASMAGEYLWLRRRAAHNGPSAGDYEKRDTLASLAMGVGSLVAPLVGPKLLAPFTPGRGRYGKALVVGAVGAAAATTVADMVGRRVEDHDRADATIAEVGAPAADRAPGGERRVWHAACRR